MLKLIYLAALLAAAASVSVSAFESKTWVKDHVYYTEGTVDAIDWYDRGLAAMVDFGNYSRWATKGIDGKDPVSAAFWENFIDFQFQEPDTMVLVYNLNLGWPLGSKGNRAKFRIDSSQIAKNELHMRLTEKPIGIEEAVLSLYGEDSPSKPGAKQVRFQIAIKFGWLMEALLDPKKYSNHLVVVLGIMIDNLHNYCLNPAPALAAPAGSSTTAQ